MHTLWFFNIKTKILFARAFPNFQISIRIRIKQGYKRIQNKNVGEVPVSTSHTNARRDPRGVHKHRPRRAARGPRHHERGAERLPQLSTHAARVRGGEAPRGAPGGARAGRIVRPDEAQARWRAWCLLLVPAIIKLEFNTIYNEGNFAEKRYFTECVPKGRV